MNSHKNGSYKKNTEKSHITFMYTCVSYLEIIYCICFEYVNIQPPCSRAELIQQTLIVKL